MRDHKLLSNFSILEDTWKFSLLENTVNCTWQYIEIRESNEQIFDFFNEHPKYHRENFISLPVLDNFWCIGR